MDKWMDGQIDGHTDDRRTNLRQFNFIAKSMSFWSKMA